MAHHTDLGRAGEETAATYLEEKGFKIIDRNYRFEKGELDLVCFLPAERYEDGGELVFVEVKTRRGKSFGEAVDAISRTKQRLIMRTSEAYLHERRLEGSPARFDVVCIDWEGEEPQIEHIEHAFGMVFG
ncbi:YraN family protein [soil metagenome]